MRRGSTPTHWFPLPIEADLVEKLELIYKQSGKTMLEKDLTNGIVLEGEVASLELTEAETFAFDSFGLVSIQARILTKGGQVLPSNVITVTVGELLFSDTIEESFQNEV